MSKLNAVKVGSLRAACVRRPREPAIGVFVPSALQHAAQAARRYT